MPGPVKEMVCAACVTVNVNICVAGPMNPLDTDNVTVNMPTCVGVPERLPVMGFSETPIGNDPVVIANVNVAGVPVAVTLNDPGVLTVKLALLTLVMFGGVGAGVGVTMTLPDAGPAPWLLFAVTEQV